jgi:hypothetical protein
VRESRGDVRQYIVSVTFRSEPLSLSSMLAHDDRSRSMVQCRTDNDGSIHARTGRRYVGADGRQAKGMGDPLWRGVSGRCAKVLADFVLVDDFADPHADLVAAGERPEWYSSQLHETRSAACYLSAVAMLCERTQSICTPRIRGVVP